MVILFFFFVYCILVIILTYIDNCNQQPVNYKYLLITGKNMLGKN